jgi:hypothetical protein
MAANTRANAATWAREELMTSTQANTIDTNAAMAVNRASTQSGVKVIPMVGYCLGTGSTLSGYPPHFTNTSATAVYFDLSCVPQGHTISGITCSLKPSSGHTVEPATLPTINLFAYDLTGVLAKYSAKQYVWESTAAYHAGIAVGIIVTAAVWTSVATVAHDTYQYFCSITNEGGTGAVAGMTIRSIRADVTCDTASGGADFSFWL